ncbi:MAG: hypothetical protein ACI9V1_001380 [Spirosomataceae bacterium]
MKKKSTTIMKTINKNWFWVIGGLLLLNISLLGFIWIKKPNRQPPPFLEEKLNFSVQQKQQFEELKAEHRSSMESIKNEIDALKEEMYAGFPEQTLSKNTLEALAAKIGAKKTESELLTFNHFQELQKICDAEQRKLLGEVINEIVNGIDRPMPPNREQGHRSGPPPMREREGRMPPPPR